MTRPFVWLSLAFMLGIGVDYGLGIPAWMIGTGVISLIALLFIFPSTQRFFVFCLAFLLLGMFVSQTQRMVPANQLSHYESLFSGEDITVTGTIISDPQARAKRTTFYFEAEEVRKPDVVLKTRSKIFVQVFGTLDGSYGEKWQISGRLHKPYDFQHGRFSYADYLKKHDVTEVFSVGRDQPKRLIDGQGAFFHKHIFQIRRNWAAVLHSSLPPVSAGFMREMLLGERSPLVSNFRAVLSRTGTVHILSIGGEHIGMMACLLWIILGVLCFSSRIHWAAMIIVLAVYAVMVDAQPPVVRAVEMFAVFAFGRVIERDNDAANSLGVAAFCILLFDPAALFDIGFQLSFACVASIFIFFPLLSGRLKQTQPNFYRGWRRRVVDVILVSFAVTIGTAGLVAWYFQMFSPVALLTNLLIIPLTTLAVWLGFAVILFGLCLPPAVFIFSTCLLAVLSLMAAASTLCDKIPLGCISLPMINLWQVLFYYIFLLLCYFTVTRLVKLISKS
ncbi:MAG: ComEC family competence protein [Candidatus Omnitrophica bacterium]|nr:ComEC family competence protein [Candidatus Omnitrophota bacterium]